MTEDVDTDHYIAELYIDEDSLPTPSADTEHERRVAVFDLLEKNVFRPEGSERGPYLVHLVRKDDRLILNVQRTNGFPCGGYSFSLKPFRRTVKDYFMICES